MDVLIYKHRQTLHHLPASFLEGLNLVVDHIAIDRTLLGTSRMGHCGSHCERRYHAGYPIETNQV